MTLLYDLVATQPNGTGKRHGGGKYGEIILERMLQRNLDFACFYDSRLWLNPAVQQACTASNIVLYDVANKSLEDIIEESKATLIYSALPDHIIGIKNCKVLGTIHGLRLIERPFDFFSAYHFLSGHLHSTYSILRLWNREKTDEDRNVVRQQMQRQIGNSNFKFVTVSNHSKYSLLSQFPTLKEENIKVFYSPSTFKCGSKHQADEVQYFMMVSGNRWDKNNLRGIIALDRLFSAGYFPNHKVVVTGINYKENKLKSQMKKILGWDYDCGKYRIKNKGRFVFKGYVSDKELSDLYANAYAFIYPSLNEGFGYPPLEAMGNGVPVVASAIASIPEILADAALYFTPFSVEEMMNRIVMLSDEKIYKTMTRKATERFSVVKQKQDEDLDLMIDYIISEV